MVRGDVHNTNTCFLSEKIIIVISMSHRVDHDCDRVKENN